MLQTVFLRKPTMLCLITFLFGLSMCNAQCNATGWKKFSQGETFSVALKEDGTLWMWGQNINGILGNGSGTTTVVKHPTQIGTDTDWTDISVGRWFVLAKKINNDLYGWGDNAWGNLATGNTTAQYAPYLMAQNVKSFSAGYHHSMIVKTDGTMWGVGANLYGQLAVGNAVNQLTWNKETSNATDWDKVSSGYYNSFGIKANGTLWSTGSNGLGITGTGNLAGVATSFVQVGTDTDWKEISCGAEHVLGLKTTGKLFGWGNSDDGRLGITSAGAISTPQAVEASNIYTHIATSWDGSAIIKSDGTLYVFGVDNGGTTGNSGDVPMQLGTSNDWKTLALRVGGYHFGAVRNDSSIWAWGTDNLYQLGNDDGLAQNKNVPTQVSCSDFLAVDEIHNNESKFSLYPNPAKDIVNIKSHQNLDQIKIYNANGLLVKFISNLNNASVINISDLPAGIYLVKANNENKSFKLVKK